MAKRRLTPKPNPIEEGRRQFDSYARYSSLAIQMGLIIAAGVFGGVKLDQWLKLKFPIFTLILSILSFSTALYLAVKDLIRKK
ncbi:MAG TPA: AtpZ/AtpI family protein [Bacteroidales bacterium]|nr:AtpZ/AtpI family protein [Bacteroidales bacterium]